MECAAEQVAAAGSGAAGPVGSTGEGASTASSTSGDSVGGGSASGAGAGPATTAGAGGNHAPTEGAPCNFSEPTWLGYVISPMDMAYGASDPGGSGFCEGWVWFDEEWFTFNMFDYDEMQIYSVDANGSTDFAPGCTVPHCGTLFFSDGAIDEQSCSVEAVCEGGVAHSVGFTW
jgi:hypothetical protein